MANDDKLTATKLCAMLKEKYSSMDVSVRYKMKAKHPPKVSVWAGISACKVVVFTRMLTATRCIDILEAALLERVFPDGHRFQQDNDPKHIYQ